MVATTRDFFGLGSFSPPPPPSPLLPDLLPSPDLPIPSPSPPSFPSLDLPPTSSSDPRLPFPGMKDPIWNQSPPGHEFLSLRSAVGAKHIEGSADSQCNISHPQSHLNGIRGPGGITNGDSRLLAADNHSNQNGGQLTIFYAGHVNVYEGVPVGKARAIMDLAAATANASPKILTGSVPAPHPFKKQPLQLARNVENIYFNDGVQICRNHYATEQIRQSTPPVNMLLECHTPNTACSDSSSQLMVPQALPQARKASLTRFLERRKERMHVICPYRKKDSAQEQTMQSPISDSKSGASSSKQYDLNSILMAISGDYAEEPQSSVKEQGASIQRRTN